MAGDPVRLTVNGRAVEVAADRDAPLLYVLREALGLDSVRFGCGEGACGVCTVLVDGRPEHACATPLWAVAGKAVETVEGLPDDDPLLAAFAAERAGQCGYCLSGIVMRAKALLAATPAPDAREVAAALEGHLCRCGAHPRILRAIVRAGAASGHASAGASS